MLPAPVSQHFFQGELSLSQAPAKLLPKVTERLADADVSTRGPAHGNIEKDDLGFSPWGVPKIYYKLL